MRSRPFDFVSVRPKHTICGASVMLVLLLLAPAVTAGEVVTVEGVPHIRNGETPPGGVERRELEELWRVGGEDDDLLLGLPTRVAIDGQGRIHILDAQLNHVHVFSSEGELLATHFREGEGPGEIRNPADLIVTADGTMGVLQEYPGQVIRQDRQGNPLPMLHPGGSPEEGGQALLMSGRARGERIVLCGMTRKMGSAGVLVSTQFLAAFAPEGPRLATYLEVVPPERDRTRAPNERDLIQPHHLAWDVAPDGRVFVAQDWERYAIAVYAPDGTLERVIERRYVPWHRTTAEKDRLGQMFRAGSNDPNARLGVSEIAPTISIFQRGVQVADDGSLWVLTSRGNRTLPEGILARFDVFDTDGHFRRQVEFACPGDPWNDYLYVLDEQRVLRIRRFVDALVTSFGPGGLPPDETGGDSAPAVICYRVRS